jgi:hypothetical protein
MSQLPHPEGRRSWRQTFHTIPPPPFYDISINLFKNVIELSNSEILVEENLPIGNILSEGASRPLISEKSPVV